MLVQQAQVFVGQFLTVHLFQPLGEHTAVEPDEALLGQLADERGDILLLHVGVGVELAARSCVGGVAIINKEGKFVEHLAIFGVLLTVEHERLGYSKVFLSHQGYLHLVLYFLHAHPVGYVDAPEDVDEVFFCGERANRQEGLADGVFDFFNGERLAAAVSLHDLYFRTAHIICFYFTFPYRCGSAGRGRKKAESSLKGEHFMSVLVAFYPKAAKNIFVIKAGLLARPGYRRLPNASPHGFVASVALSPTPFSRAHSSGNCCRLSRHSLFRSSLQTVRKP